MNGDVRGDSGLFGRYLLLEQLSQGGMAQIWRARHIDDEREVVIKTLLPRLLDQPIFGELFAAEARITRLLRHPGIVRIVDDGEVNGMRYLAMERIDGWDLSKIQRTLRADQRIPVEIVLSIAICMCRAVGYAHAWRDERSRPRAVVHGDLSPSNLMVRRDGGVTLIDFGVAHMDPRVARGRAHLVIGKSGYLAPELLDECIATPRSDVFSTGVVLHELLARRQLFATSSERETLRRLTEAPIPPPSQLNPRVPPELDAVVLRALSRDPAERFASANELAAALERLERPARATRHDVAAFLGRLFGGGQRQEESVTTPIAPSLPSVLAARLQATPMVRQSTATINERRRRLGVDPATSRRPRHERGSRPLVVLAAIVLALLSRVPEAPADWMPMIPVAPSTTSAIAPPQDAAPPQDPAPPQQAAPSREPPPLAAPARTPSRPPSPPTAHRRHRSHTRHARVARTIANGRVVDPFQ